MKIAVVGTGYVGLVTGTCLAESGNDVVCIDKVAAKVEMLRAGKIPIYEPGLAELVHRNAATAGSRSPPSWPRGSPRPSWSSSPSGPPRGTTAGPTSKGSGPSAARSPPPDGPQDDHHQEHRAGRHQRRTGPDHGRDHRGFLRRRQQPRVPQGRGGDRRLQQARPRRRRRPPARGLRAARDLYRPFLRTERPFLVDDAGIGRDDQIRGQLHAGHQDQLHQRDGQPLRALSRRHQRGPPGDRPRPADRLQLPVPRGRLRRLVLPQGRPRHDPHGPLRGRPLADDGGGRRW